MLRSRNASWEKLGPSLLFWLGGSVLAGGPTLSYPASAVIIGCDNHARLEENVQIARGFTQLSPKRRWRHSANLPCWSHVGDHAKLHTPGWCARMLEHGSRER